MALIGSGDIESVAAWAGGHGLAGIDVFVQDGYEVARRYLVRGSPSAVLIDIDGRVASPVARGPIAIRELLAATTRTPRRDLASR